MARHLLALPHSPWVGAVSDGARRAVRERHAVRGGLAGEAPPLHDARKALVLGAPRHVDALPRDKVAGGDGRADRQQRVLAYAALDDGALERHALHERGVCVGAWVWERGCGAWVWGVGVWCGVCRGGQRGAEPE
eukprot:359083-Chlamydomonas_euryale.AAC.4